MKRFIYGAKDNQFNDFIPEMVTVSLYDPIELTKMLSKNYVLTSKEKRNPYLDYYLMGEFDLEKGIIPQEPELVFRSRDIDDQLKKIEENKQNETEKV